MLNYKLKFRVLLHKNVLRYFFNLKKVFYDKAPKKSDSA